MLFSDEPADAPACSVEILASRPDREGKLRQFGRQGGYTGERYVVETIVDLEC